MFTTIWLVNASITSHNYPFVVFIMERTLKLYSHSNFQGYNIVLLALVTMLYIRCPEPTHHWRFIPFLPTSPHFLHLLWPLAAPILLYVSEFDVFRFHIKVRLYDICLCLTYFTEHNALKAMTASWFWIFSANFSIFLDFKLIQCSLFVSLIPLPFISVNCIPPGSPLIIPSQVLQLMTWESIWWNLSVWLRGMR